MKRMCRRAVIVLAVPLLLIALLHFHRGPRFFATTVLPSLGGRNTAAHAINERGQIVGVAQTERGDYHLVVWDLEGNIRDLGFVNVQALLPASFFINDLGQIAGWARDPNGNGRAFLQDPDGSRYPLGTLGDRNCEVRGLNNLGQVVGVSETADGTRHAFLWDKAAGMRDLGTFGDNTSAAKAINDAGLVLADVAAGPPKPFLRDPNGGTLAIGLREACDLNDQSYIVGRAHGDGKGGDMALWHKDKGVTQRLEEDASPDIAAINDVNQVACSMYRYRRFLPLRLFTIFWDPAKGRIPLDKQLPRRPKGVFWVQDLNNQGCVVGVIGSRRPTASHAVLLRPIPERWDK